VAADQTGAAASAASTAASTWSASLIANWPTTSERSEGLKLGAVAEASTRSPATKFGYVFTVISSGCDPISLAES
jgi:hypothetical protein